METTTEKKLSLVEKFNQVGEPPSDKWVENHPGETYYPNQVDMKWELCDLLEAEAEDRLNNERASLLNEYKEYFEWDATYSLDVSWVIDGTTVVTCEDLDELKEYLENGIEHEMPDSDDLSMDDGYVSQQHCNVYLSGFGLKKDRFSYSLLLTIESEKELDDMASRVKTAINHFMTYKVVSCTQAT